MIFEGEILDVVLGTGVKYFMWYWESLLYILSQIYSTERSRCMLRSIPLSRTLLTMILYLNKSWSAMMYHLIYHTWVKRFTG